MSLAIDVGAVVEVLLADGWHRVLEKTFYFDAYEYLDNERVLHGGGEVGVCSRGFSFVELVADRDVRRRRISGPLTSILAVREHARASNGQRRSLPRSLTAQVIARDGLTCQICEEPVDADDLHIDHIHPVAEGGLDDLGNLRVTHGRCNLARARRKEPVS